MDRRKVRACRECVQEVAEPTTQPVHVNSLTPCLFIALHMRVSSNRNKLECGPMPKVMAAQPNKVAPSAKVPTVP